MDLVEMFNFEVLKFFSGELESSDWTNNGKVRIVRHGVIDAFVEYDLFLVGVQKSHLEDVSSKFETVTNVQNNGGWGFKFGVGGTFPVGRILDFGPYVSMTFWDIDESDPEDLKYNGAVMGSVIEPDNTHFQLNYGLKFFIR